MATWKEEKLTKLHHEHKEHCRPGSYHDYQVAVKLIRLSIDNRVYYSPAVGFFVENSYYEKDEDDYFIGCNATGMYYLEGTRKEWLAIRKALSNLAY